MISLILLKLLPFSQILQGVHKLSSSPVYLCGTRSVSCEFGTETPLVVKWMSLTKPVKNMSGSHFSRSKEFAFTFTFTFMHLADAFIQSDLQCIHLHMSVHEVLHIFNEGFWLGVDRYVFFRADTDYYRSSRPITDILNRYTCLV